MKINDYADREVMPVQTAIHRREGVGHNIHLEKPDALIGPILDMAARVKNERIDRHFFGCYKHNLKNNRDDGDRMKDRL